MSTTAERDDGAAAQAKFLAVLIDDGEIAFDAHRTVIEDGDFGGCQGILRRRDLSWIYLRQFKDNGGSGETQGSKRDGAFDKWEIVVGKTRTLKSEGCGTQG